MMTLHPRPVILATGLLASLFCGIAAGGASPPGISGRSANSGGYGFDASGMDPNLRPGNDFYSYANGAWLARTTIPNDQADFGVFDTINTATENRVTTILDES